MLDRAQLKTFRDIGHVTVPGIFGEATVAAALADVEVWGRVFLRELAGSQKRWYLEKGAKREATLRKLDEPVFHRAIFQEMARAERLTRIVEKIIGTGVSVFYSQVFLKPPEAGGPKPVHQDNFYFGPDDNDSTLTVWIALDTATEENGCLFYADGSHKCGIYEHFAPVDEPFNLQIASEYLDEFTMTAAPVPAGGISIHHGNTWHQSAANTSLRSRRAVAMHFIRNSARLAKPALAYSAEKKVQIT